MKKSIYNIFKTISESGSEQDVIESLRLYGSPVIRTMLKYAFDPNIKWLLPEGPPPYKPCEYLDQEGRLLSEIRKLYLFIEGGNPNLNTVKREMLFIQLLESIDKEDAELMCHIKDKKLPFKNITQKVAKKAFPEDY
jgi:hypothetical protein